ncbi:LysR family transcriptional regulator [Chimaeribacter californicus]|uniref:LysR family transcriptional regulator n=1 Tax=Chimaeribacter californicus TaxID=2060067 RepID=A0A2N5DZ59_9GAMM|nr:LysR family transcriptional regulator [Chimaeribacter californicus]PLR33022.1 LysR family transcriptional regulator [Chimaeribacter californicus]
MDLKRLRYFCVIVEQGSISKASRILNISQPPLSKRLQELEEEVGTALVTRNGSGIKTTEAGMVLYLRACDILRSVEEARSEALQAARPKAQVLRIGISYLYQCYFSPLVATFCQKLGGVKIETVISDSSTLETMLSERRIDVALIQQPQPLAGYECVSLPPIKVVAVISRKLLAAPPGAHILLTEVGQLPLILLRRIHGEGTFEFISAQLRKLGVQPNIIISGNEPRIVFDMLSQGIEAASLMPASEVPEQVKNFCYVVDIYPTPNVFFPSFVKLAATPQQPELMNILLHYQCAVTAG